MTMAIPESAFESAIKCIVTDVEQLKIPCRLLDLHDDPQLISDVIYDLTITAMDLNSSKKQSCLGLAANQLGYDVRIFVLRKKNGKYRAFVNPELLSGTQKISSTEGCFSFPGKQSTVKRHKEIIVKDAYSLKPIVLRGDEARGFQHELDHLNGIII
jgi:peptide deformylase